MDTILHASQDFFSNETAVPKLISNNKNMDTKVICKAIAETSASYNVTTLLDGKYIILTPCEMNNNFNMEFKTYVEVNSMEIKNKINRIYAATICASAIIIAIALIINTFNILSVPTEVLFAIVFFTVIGSISLGIDYYYFNRDQKKHE